MTKFRILSIHLLESHFKMNVDYKFTDKPISIKTGLDIDYKIKRKKKELWVTETINSDNKEQPFIFNISFGGIFIVDEIPPQKDLDKMANINCAAIILQYIREAIADLTRRADIPPFHMNPINFVDLYNDKLKTTSKKPRKKKS